MIFLSVESHLVFHNSSLCITFLPLFFPTKYKRNCMSEQLLYKAIPGIVIGALAGGAITMIKSTFSTAGVQSKLQFKPESFDMDPACAELFLKLQQFRVLAPQHFDEAGSELDSLFCLEKQLMKREVEWNVSDHPTATRYYRQMCDELQLFLDTISTQLVRNRVGVITGVNGSTTPLSSTETEQAKQVVRDANVLIKRIKECAQTHVKKIAGTSPHRFTGNASASSKKEQNQAPLLSDTLSTPAAAAAAGVNQQQQQQPVSTPQSSPFPYPYPGYSSYADVQQHEQTQDTFETYPTSTTTPTTPMTMMDNDFPSSS